MYFVKFISKFFIFLNTQQIKKKTVDTIKKIITFYFIIMNFDFLLNSLISSVNYTVDF